MKNSPTGQAQQVPTRHQGIAYGLPLLSVYFLFGPIAILQGIYAKYFGLALTSIATVLFVARLFDAISDPIIGYCADRYYDRTGSRKPFVVSGGLLFIFSSWFLYVPPSDVSFEYFLGWFLVFYLAFTLFEIPHMAWGSELATSSQGKNQVYGFRSFFSLFGALLFFTMPLLPWFDTNELTPQTLKWSVLVAGSLMLPLLYISIKIVPDSLSESSEYLKTRQAKKESLNSLFRTLFSNKPLRVLTAAHICTGFGSGMWITLMFIFVDAYLGLGEHFAWVYAISFGLSMAALKLWYLLANRWGKQFTWIVGMLLTVIGLMGIGLLSPGGGDGLKLLVCMTLVSSGIAAFSIMLPSLMSDVIDYGTWKFGTDRAATYFSLYTFINKSVGALGGALGLAIAGWSGFDPTVTSHSDEAIMGLRFGVSWIPAAFILLSIVFIASIPITARRHAIIRRRLDGIASMRNERVRPWAKSRINNTSDRSVSDKTLIPVEEHIV
jgi:glycoside/pentoside/hexuronide:cation symporter, GPH family